MRATARRAGSWYALLEGEDARRATEAVESIGDALAVRSHTRQPHDHSLADGRPGLALLYAYLARARPGRGFEETASRLTSECVELLATVRMDASLFDGFTGILWLLAHLRGAGDPSSEHPNAAIDRRLLRHLGTSPWRRAYDLTSGLVGIGVYALERLPDPLAVACLELVIERLDDLAEKTEAGASWFTPPSLVPELQRPGAPAGYTNLGVAHGVPGVVALLAAASGAGVAPERSRALADAAVRWLLDARLADSGAVRYGYWIAAGAAPTPARSGWCYGDPGIAATLLVAARSSGVQLWQDTALELALVSAGRPFEETGVEDAWLCHGAAGLAHMFNRMYQATGAPELATAARAWFARTLDLLEGPIDSPGFLTGAAGAALALLAATSDVEPAWDRLLLLSVPPAELLRAPSDSLR